MTPQEGHLADFEPIPPNVLNLLPGELVRKNLIIPLSKVNDRLLAATPKAKHIIKPKGIDQAAGCPVDLVAVPLEEIARFIEEHFPLGNKDQPKTLPPPPKDQALPSKNLPEPLLSLVQDATACRATEILIDNKGGVPSLRYRIRGILVTPEDQRDWSIRDAIYVFTAVRRIGKTKGLREMYWTEWRGKTKFNDNHYLLEMMLTETPDMTLLNIRVANDKELLYDPLGWGMTLDEADQMRNFLHKKEGVIVFCGPKNEGVENLFYGSLRFVAKPHRHVITVENEIEDWIEGVEQFAAQNKSDYFKQMLQSALQHKPDILAVNPFEKKEVMEPCLEGSLRGILVFGRSFARDAADFLFQLAAREIEPYLVGSALTGVVVQQRIRLICQKCLNVDPDGTDLAHTLGIPATLRPINFYRGEGCPWCHKTGFDKETYVFEMLEMSDDIRGFLKKSKDPDALRALMRNRAHKTLRQVALHKALTGQTSLREVIRTTP